MGIAYKCQERKESKRKPPDPVIVGDELRLLPPAEAEELLLHVLGIARRQQC